MHPGPRIPRAAERSRPFHDVQAEARRAGRGPGERRHQGAHRVPAPARSRGDLGARRRVRLQRHRSDSDRLPGGRAASAPHRRDGAAETGAGAEPRGMRRGDHRGRRDREGGRGDAPGRLRLPDEAAQSREVAGGAPARPLPPGAGGASRRDGRAARRAARARAPHRALASSAAGHGSGARDRLDARDGPHRGRDRHRQGAGGTGHPSEQPAQARALRLGQLRGARGRRDRERAVRPRARRLHRSDCDAARALRDGRRRYFVSRRGGRDLSGGPGQAPSRDPGPGVRAGGRDRDDEDRRPADRRHQP